MKKRIVSIVLSVFMLISLLPYMPIAADTKPTIYIAGDVYGAPGETVTVPIGFRNMAGKNIREFQICLRAGKVSVLPDAELSVTSSANCYGYSDASGNIGVSGGVNSFSADGFLNVQVAIPESAFDGDTYPLELVKSDLYPSVLQWEDGSSPNGDVVLEGATLRVSRFKPVDISVQDTVAAVGDEEIRIPIIMSKSNAVLASCTGLSFVIGGDAASKVAINASSSKEFSIQGKNAKYTVSQPDREVFSLGYSSGYINAVSPDSDEFRIFELVLDVKSPLAVGDTLTVSISAGDDAFKVYGDSETDLIKLNVLNYRSGTVKVRIPYDWEVISEKEGTARLTKYTGRGTEVEIPSVIISDGSVGTKGKVYTVVELYGDEDTGGLFCDNDKVTAITIPETVRTVYEYAFFGCTSLKRLVVKSHEMKIEEKYGQTFLHYLSGRNYKLLPDVQIESYESASVNSWALENGANFKNLIAFAGVQLGSGQLRFVGAMADLEYQNVYLEIVVGSKTYADEMDNVFTTLKGRVDGVERVVVTTDAEVYATNPKAHYVEAYRYLFGYELTVTANMTFTVTPKATTAYGAVVSGKTVTVTYLNGQISYSE